MRKRLTRKPIKRPEQALQRACVGLLQRFYDRPGCDFLWSAINPVPGKSIAAAAISKAMGMKAGMPDMIFIRSSFEHIVFFIEFKAGKGQLSPAQKALKLLFGAFSPPIEVYEVRSIEQFVAALADEGIEPKRKFTLKTLPADEYLTQKL
jgi:hypothetical protein